MSHLEARPLAGVFLEVHHGLQDFAVAAGDETHGTQDLQHGHFGADVLGAEALSDDVDALGMSEDVGAALRVVHQSLEAADQRGVDLRLARIVLHVLQEVQQTRQAVLIDEAGHKTAAWRAESIYLLKTQRLTRLHLLEYSSVLPACA